jgi:hypothetical protein
MTRILAAVLPLMLMAASARAQLNPCPSTWIQHASGQWEFVCDGTSRDAPTQLDQIETMIKGMCAALARRDTGLECGK